MSIGVFRFKAGNKVWVRDVGKSGGGFHIVEAAVEEQHYHPDRHPFYPNGEGYQLEGDLWWSCYPGCRVFATKELAKAARMSLTITEFENLAREQGAALDEQQSQSKCSTNKRNPASH